MTTVGPRKLRIDLAYDGTDFAGWQFQPDHRTVQGVLEATLSKLQGGERVVVRGAGRTDSGAHATGQVADGVVTTELGDDDLGYALRRLLPPDLRPWRVRTTHDEFHAIWNAVSKTYRYRVDLSRHGDPFLARYALHHPYEFDREVVEAGLRRLPGCRDWSGFTSSSCTKVDRVRDLTEARVAEDGDHGLCFTFSGSGFLQYMVRNLVGTLLEIGRGRMEVERIDRILETGNRDLAGPTAAARGLCLSKVTYLDDEE